MRLGRGSQYGDVTNASVARRHLIAIAVITIAVSAGLECFGVAISTASAKTGAGSAPTWHVVTEGESLWSIAAAKLGRHAGDAKVAAMVQRLASLNARRLRRGINLIIPGERLRLTARPSRRSSGAVTTVPKANWSASIIRFGTGYHWASGSQRVREAQRLLACAHYASGPIDGRFGPLTLTAVQRFQRAHGLTDDGVVGRHTLRALRAACSTAHAVRHHRARRRSTPVAASVTPTVKLSPLPTVNSPATSAPITPERNVRLWFVLCAVGLPALALLALRGPLPRSPVGGCDSRRPHRPAVSADGVRRGSAVPEIPSPRIRRLGSRRPLVFELPRQEATQTSPVTNVVATGHAGRPPRQLVAEKAATESRLAEPVASRQARVPAPASAGPRTHATRTSLPPRPAAKSVSHATPAPKWPWAPSAPAAPSVSVVIPRFRDARNLLDILSALPSGFEQVLVVDRGRTGHVGAGDSQKLSGAEIMRESRGGWGAAFTLALTRSRGEMVVVLDGSWSTDPAEISRLIGALRAGAAFAKGSRYLPGGGSAGSTVTQRVLDRALSRLVNAFFGTSYTDVGLGLSAFWRDSLPNVDLRSADVEGPALMSIQVAKAGLRIAEVPVFAASLRNDWRRDVTYVYRHLRAIFSERWRPGPQARIQEGVTTVRLAAGTNVPHAPGTAAAAGRFDRDPVESKGRMS